MDSLNVSRASATGNPRNKTALKPGRSLMDWIKLTNSSADLSGTGNRLRDISPEELAQHNKQNDAWLAIRGLVYNVTSYFEFHPGGEDELMRGVGIDATDLFDEVHKWVNYESMLKKCLVGRLKAETKLPPKRPPIPKIAADNGLRMPPPTPLISEVTADWMQSPSNITIVLYTRQKGLDAHRVSTSIDGSVFRARIYSDDWLRCYDYQIRMTEDVDPPCHVSVSATTGKVELRLQKKRSDIHWTKLGDLLSVADGFRTLNQAPPFFRKAILSRKVRVNHNVFLFTVTFPPSQDFYVPVGWHVQLKLCLEDGSELVRSYTPVTADLSSCQTIECPSKNGSTELNFLIKIYSEGPFTSVLNRLAEGGTIEVSDASGNFVATQLKGKNLVAIAAGTGITPMVRLIMDALRSDRRAWLLFFNRSRRDIIWKDEFRELELQYPDLFKVWHILSEPDDEWVGLRGRISNSILATTIYPSLNDCPSDGSNLACVCGPSDFTLETLRLLESAGYKEETVHAFSG